MISGEVISSGTAIFCPPKHFNFIDPKLTYEINNDELTVYACSYARSIRIGSPNSDIILSDNYFDLNSGKKTVKILFGNPESITLKSVYDIGLS